MDIYSFSFICDNIENTIVQGKIASEGKANATITFTDIKNHKTFKGQSDANGNYSISIKPESTYNVQIKLPGYLPFYTSLSTPHQCDAYNLYQVINASFVTDSLYVHAGQTLSVKNAFYRHIKQGDYKNAKQDSQLSALIGSYNDTASIWERDTNVAITYTPAQRDSLNPKKAIAINMDTAQAITAPEIASAKTAPVKSNGKAQKNGKVIAANIDTTGKAANPALAGTKTKVAPLKIVSSPALPKLPVVYFGFNKYSIAAEYHPMLDSLAIYAKANGKYRIQIEGNTDTVGSVAYNKRLSLLRAKAVADYLERKGIAAKRIHTEGNGKRHLAVVGDGTNARNRRSDILIIE
ncbi:MAG: OmpA family protein [Bacteroidia bacterium]